MIALVLCRPCGFEPFVAFVQTTDDGQQLTTLDQMRRVSDMPQRQLNPCELQQHWLQVRQIRRGPPGTARSVA